MDFIHLEQLPIENEETTINAILKEVRERIQKNTKGRFYAINPEISEMVSLINELSLTLSIEVKSVCQMLEQHRVQAYGVKVGFNKKIDKEVLYGQVLQRGVQ